MEFFREPRLPAPPMAEGDLTVDPPPALPKAAPANAIARLLPVAMLVAAGGMMLLYFTSGGASAGRGPMFLFFPAMMAVSVIGSLAYNARTANHTAQLNDDRRSYLEYLEGLDRTLAGAAASQHHSLHWTHPDPATLWTVVGGRRMWERSRQDLDYCKVRIGVGEQPLCTRLIAPSLGPVETQDPVTSAALGRLIRRRAVVADVPVVVLLRTASALTVNADPEVARALLRAIVCQLTVLHSPDDVRIAAVVAPTAAWDWDWLKWLAHHQHWRLADELGPARMTYHSLAEAITACRPPDEGTAPHVVVVVDDGSVPLIKQPFTDGPRLHVDDSTRLDGLTVQQAALCARRLAPYRHRLDDAGTTATMGWLELMGVRELDRIGAAEQWPQPRRLRAPIGVSEQGKPVMLDIKEAAQGGMGPHGLCVGATGSGKSEFLRTLLLGMVVSHPPDVLNLVLVDFKGGATFLGMDRVRHVSAVITNLAEEAPLVSRMRDALAGEMNRRQEMLRAAGRFASVADYEQARRRGLTMPPLPALFVVVDEFSELLAQYPEFAELFVAIGRLGRSLGMHLLLASQRLDEGRLRGLESHLSYRVCLKTFSASESRAVLSIPDAHHLPSSPGAAYLKTADGQMIRFQTAYVSAPQRVSRPTGDGVSPEPQVLTAAAVGSVVARSERSPAAAPSVARSLMDAVLDRMAGHGAAAHRVWLPPLRQSPALDALLACAPDQQPPLSVPIGLIDAPFEQRYDALMVDLAGAAGNVAIVGAPQSGKSTALRTLLTALAATNDPSAVQFYCLDFGGGALTPLGAMPHIGAVAGRSDAELCRRVIAEMEAVLRSREARFRRAGIDSMTDYRKMRHDDDPFGDVFLVVDGWATFRQEFDALEPRVIGIATQGLSFGVHLVLTASRWAELRPSLKDQIGTRIELRLGDPADSEMDRRRARQLGDLPPGRGITRDGKEMAIATPTPAVVTDDGSGRRAPRVELLPLQVPHDYGNAAVEIVIGIGETELKPVALDLVEHPHLIVLGEAECGKTATLRLLCREIMRVNDSGGAQIEIVDFRRTLLGEVETNHLSGYSMSAATLAARVPVLLERLQARMPDEGVTQQQLRTRSWWSGPEIYLVVDDYDLVAGATGNPLTPLADYLPHAKDVGLHVIVARRSGGAARAMFDPVLARMRDLGCMGLMMSAGQDEGVLLGAVRPSAQPPGRGTLITRGQPDQLIQVAWTDPPR
ncbi:type VII secretion protein EccC [Mycobacterium sp. ACS1612]|uniref:type VII secretion protein EccCa n=1 Tax=Mycobacterium sp. ACS1612 TaxID=1834117 RepID=UPI0007FEAC2E|nr:type VII secretion protein EccCa [Mycobacterium sp. ACS1612]OBF42312.1 type VII secretion protein EccC [Mycobacterium sp. ACS1612]